MEPNFICMAEDALPRNFVIKSTHTVPINNIVWILAISDRTKHVFNQTLYKMAEAILQDFLKHYVSTWELTLFSGMTHHWHWVMFGHTADLETALVVG